MKVGSSSGKRGRMCEFGAPVVGLEGGAGLVVDRWGSKLDWMEDELEAEVSWTRTRVPACALATKTIRMSLCLCSWAGSFAWRCRERWAARKTHKETRPVNLNPGPFRIQTETPARCQIHPIYRNTRIQTTKWTNMSCKRDMNVWVLYFEVANMRNHY